MKTKVTIRHHDYVWIKDCMSFNHGCTIAAKLAERLGLIGRVHVEGENGELFTFNM